VKESVLAGVFLAIAVLALAAGPGLAGERAGRVTAPQSLWLSGAVDSGDDVGAAVSIEFDPIRDITYISYYDQAHGDLRVARSVASGGNCGPMGDWSCEIVDGDAAHGDTHVGLYTSIALDPVTGFPGVAYYDVTNASLKYAAYACGPDGCGWEIATIDRGNRSLSAHAGLFPSLRYDSYRVPHIAYHNDSASPGADELHYAHQVSSGGNCGPAASWKCELVDSGDGMGLYPSLGLSANDGFPHLAYYDGGNLDLKYAWYLGSGTGNCGGDDWRCIVIDSIGDVGRHPSLHASGDAPQMQNIAYYDRTNGAVKYAYWVGFGGNCGGGLWECATIDYTIGSVSNPVGLSLETYADGTPVIAYQCPECYCTAIRRAQYVGAQGNCGPIGISPPGVFTPTWMCRTVVDGSYHGCHNVGMFLDLSINRADRAAVAFYDAPAGDLMIAYQHETVFLPLVIQ
jgi:hypothetical protein